MDVDKPHQLELLRADLAKTQRKAASKARTMAKRTTKKKPAAPKKKTTVSKTARLKPKAKRA